MTRAAVNHEVADAGLVVAAAAVKVKVKATVLCVVVVGAAAATKIKVGAATMASFFTASVPLELKDRVTDKAADKAEGLPGVEAEVVVGQYECSCTLDHNTSSSSSFPLAHGSY